MKMENTRRNRSFLNNISKEDIRNLPLQQFPGRILLIDDVSQLDFLHQKLINKKLIGFDTETRRNPGIGCPEWALIHSRSTARRGVLVQVVVRAQACSLPTDTADTAPLTPSIFLGLRTLGDPLPSWP